MAEDDSAIPRVLVIDDDENLIVSLCNLLRAIPTRPEVAKTGDAAVDCLLAASADDPFKLIILDMWVPRTKQKPVDIDFGKYFLLDIQRAFGLVPNSTPIVVFTAHDSYDDCVECIHRGAVDYVPKIRPSGRREQVEIAEFPPPVETRNMDMLIEKCCSLLSPSEPKEDEFATFLQLNGAELRRRFGGKYIAVVPGGDPSALNALAGGTESGGAVECVSFQDDALIVGETWKQVQLFVLRRPVIRWKNLAITHLPSL